MLLPNLGQGLVRQDRGLGLSALEDREGLELSWVTRSMIYLTTPVC